MKLQRSQLGHGGKPTLGTLVSNDGAFRCVTLERSVDGEHPCIPAGEYQVGWTTHHPTGPNPYRCPLLDTSALAPPRTAIQIHIANVAGELLGCIAVGECVDGDAIDCSEAAFERMMKYLGGVDSWTLAIADPPAVLA